jgi:hypothetical protein
MQVVNRHVSSYGLGSDGRSEGAGGLMRSLGVVAVGWRGLPLWTPKKSPARFGPVFQDRERLAGGVLLR